MHQIPIDIAQKRSLLFTARMRFSASGVDVRRQAIQKIIEQNLASAGRKFLTIDEIREILDCQGVFTVLRDADVRYGIKELEDNNRVEKKIVEGVTRYRLSESAYYENINLIKESERELAQIIQELFGEEPGRAEVYKNAFIRLLCTLFARLSHVYVQVILGDIKPDDFIDQKAFNEILEKVLKEENIPDPELFKYGVAKFFRESSPAFSRIKWNMAQNYYVAKALGVDEGGILLSAQALSGATFYLDTNVLLAGLIPENRHYGSFKELINVCKKFNITPSVTHITHKELIHTIVNESELVKEVINKIPDKTKPKIDSILLEPFFNAKEKNQQLKFDKWFEEFLKIAESLETGLGIQMIDDVWFEQEVDSQDTVKVADELSDLYLKLRKRQKSKSAAIHDALLLRWVDNKKSREDDPHWIITLDTTLPVYVRDPKNQINAKVLTLDALLQWTAPHRKKDEGEDALAEIFAESLRYQIMPRDVFFKLEDFKVFVVMGIETAELPAEDVEACIRHIKKVLPDVDLTKAEDREKLDREIRKKFADIGPKYKKELSRLEGMLNEYQKELKDKEKQLSEANNKISRLESEIEDKNQQIEMFRAKVQEFQEEISRKDKQEERRKLRNSVILRFIILIILWFFLESVAVIISWKYGEGDNFFLKCKSLWEFHLAAFGIPSLLFRFVMGRKRMRFLKWWKGEDVDLTK